MSYHDFSARPWPVWKDWYDALAGGKQTMQLAGTVPETKPLETVVSYQLDVPDGVNPSVVVHDGRLLVNVRTPTANVLGELIARKVLFQTKVEGPYQPSLREFNPVRLYSLAGSLGGVACWADYSTTGTLHAQAALLKLTGTVEAGWVGEKPAVLPSTRYEKNWMPCVDGDKLRIVYSVDPLAVLDAPYTVTDTTPMGGTLRGSSQLVPYNDGWLAIVHQTHLLKDAAGGNLPVYLHRFVTFDKGLTAATVGRPWHFQKKGIECVGGLAFWKDRFIISYGLDDTHPTRAAWIAGVSPETVTEMLKA